MNAKLDDSQDQVELALGAIIQSWSRLRDWLDTDRSLLQLRDEIGKAAQEWEEHKPDDSYFIHQERRLTEAEALTFQPRITLNAREKAYLDANRNVQQRKLTWQRRRQVLATVAALVMTALAVWAFWERTQAEEQTFLAVAAAGTAEAERNRATRESQIALARALAAESLRQHEVGQDERGASLAGQAFLFNQAVDGTAGEAIDAALRATLGVGHFSRIVPIPGGVVTSVAFSPDGQALASGSEDGTVRIWDLADPATNPIVLTSHEDAVYSRAFSPDGRTLASGGRNGTLQLWIASADVLSEMVCDLVWRNLTVPEWQQFIGPDIPYQNTCPDLAGDEEAPTNISDQLATPVMAGGSA